MTNNDNASLAAVEGARSASDRDSASHVAHTPGPWKAGYWTGICRDPRHVAVRRHPGPPECVYEQEFTPQRADSSWCFGICTDDPETDVVWTEYDELKIRAADAHLIAAAPEMLDALKDADDLLSNFLPYDDSRWMKVRAAIDKAEGR